MVFQKKKKKITDFYRVRRVKFIKLFSFFNNTTFLVCLQTLVAGQGLNDDMWHTLRFSRRAASLKFQIDNDSAVRGKSVNNFSLKYTFLVCTLHCYLSFNQIIYLYKIGRILNYQGFLVSIRIE